MGGPAVWLAIMLVAGTLISRRGKFARNLTMALAWIAIFGAGFVLFTFRDDLGYVAQRLKSEATGAPESLPVPSARWLWTLDFGLWTFHSR